MERENDTEIISEGRSFTLFTKLPPEIRLMIWGVASPGDVQPWSKICEIWDLKRGQDKIVTSPRTKVYMNLLRCCRESCRLAQEWKSRDTQEPCTRQWAAKSSLSSCAISTGSPLSHPMSKPSPTRWVTPTTMHV
ncbi:hypothetical protein FOPG_14734 [Fusarium oxysporum f. sp. conglutinans race 2 54008]|uniref:2EXR domain-containing protein n=1 Tax=Fusarium oxysporum f. sp. conglutinans race 2 54008 TaxID=1089457 RepID=X0H0W7_FUSOX|nr:hypothetical protein FOPG_14734 [Fusarium oxysporum f. sp. conglutinans race 2 54008]